MEKLTISNKDHKLFTINGQDLNINKSNQTDEIKYQIMNINNRLLNIASENKQLQIEIKSMQYFAYILFLYSLIKMIFGV